MGPKCPSCGKETHKHSYYCTVCGKQICHACRKTVFHLEAKNHYANGSMHVLMPSGGGFWAEGVYVCSEACGTDFLKEMKKRTEEMMRRIWEEGKERESLANKPTDYWLRSLLHAAFFEYSRAKNNLGRLSATAINEHPGFALDFESYARDPTRLLHELTELISLKQKSYRQEYDAMLRSEREKALLERVEQRERVGDYEEAAMALELLAVLYEESKLYDKARNCRDRKRQLLNKGKHVVVVDLNRLLQQVRDGGIVAVYRCPHCGGKLKIDKEASVESLKVCEHCGSGIEAMELADFIKTALS